ncbi:MAG: hypothetical protein M3380_01755, partial [Chloroflexota bacterium]|nr:hypothetical protein [Chloroflexota bacterium]
LREYEAVCLFVERAKAAKFDFALTEQNAPAVLEITRRLDGLPLAIELAAARVRLLPPQAILSRLVGTARDRSLQLLSGGARDLPARQQTLRAAIDWSYTLLDAREQTLFMRLGVFVRGCMLEAVEAICNAEGTLDVLEGLLSLVDKSLLEQRDEDLGEPRFVMLETIREYALEQLEQKGEAPTIQRRHADYYLQLAERAEPELKGSQQLAWFERLEREHGNLRVAISWSLEQGDAETPMRIGRALWYWWWTRGHHSEGRRWMRKALARGRTAPPALRAWTRWVSGAMTYIQGDYQRAISHSDETLALFRQVGDKRGEALTLLGQGLVAMYEQDFAGAAVRFDESLGLFRNVQDKWGIALVLQSVGRLAAAQGNNAQAVAALEESVGLFQEVGNKSSLVFTLHTLALVELQAGNYIKATALLTYALELGQMLEHKAVIASCMEGLAGVAAVQAQDQAQHLEDARSSARRAAQLFGAAEALREAVDAPLSPTERSLYEPYLAAVHRYLDDVVFLAAWAEGRSMSLDQAIAYALAEDTPV